MKKTFKGSSAYSFSHSLIGKLFESIFFIFIENTISWFSEPSSNPDSKHLQTCFSVFLIPIMHNTIQNFEPSIFKQTLNLTLTKIINPYPVQFLIEIFLNFPSFFTCQLQLSKIKFPIVSKIDNTSWFHILIYFIYNHLLFFRRYRW